MLVTRGSRKEEIARNDEGGPVRDRKRRLLNELEWILIGLAWILGLALGYAGFRLYFQQAGVRISFLDLMYFTVQLVLVESGGVTAPVPWQLEVARFTLPLLAAYTAIKTLALVFLKQAQAVRLLFIRGHVLICGLNDQSLLMSRGFIQSGEKVVLINGSKGNPLVEEARSMGAIVVEGEPDRESVLTGAAVSRAGQLVCVEKDDRLNVEIAVLAERISAEKRSHVLPTSIHIVNSRLWDVLQGSAMGSRDFEHLRLELFNMYDRGAKLLLQETLSVRPILNWAQARLLVLGVGNLGRALVVHAARAAFQNAGNGEQRLEITVIDNQAVEVCASLEQRYPLLHRVCRLIPLELDFTSTAFAAGEYLYDSSGADVFDAVYLCVQDDSAAMGIILALHSHLQHCNAPLFVRTQKREGLGDFLHLKSDESARGQLYMFPLIENTSTPEILAEGSREVLAVSLHQEYVRHQLGKGRDPSEIALQSWQDLPDHLREANRCQVDRMQCHLLEIGYKVVPDPEWGEAIEPLTDDEVEQAACMEHAGWCEDLRCEGWKYAPGEKDPIRKTHPALLPWDELPEEDREKNRVPMRGFPDLLARLGFKLVRSPKEKTPSG